MATKQNTGLMVYLILGVTVGLIALVFIGSLGGQVYELVEDDIEALVEDVVNESVTMSNTTWAQLSNDNLVNGTITITNATHSFGMANFTVHDLEGQVLTIEGDYSGQTFDVSYTHGNAEAEGHIKAGIISGFQALETTGDMTQIIILTVVVIFVLGIVMGVGTGQKGGNTGAL